MSFKKSIKFSCLLGYFWVRFLICASREKTYVCTAENYMDIVSHSSHWVVYLVSSFSSQSTTRERSLLLSEKKKFVARGTSSSYCKEYNSLKLLEDISTQNLFLFFLFFEYILCSNNSPFDTNISYSIRYDKLHCVF